MDVVILEMNRLYFIINWLVWKFENNEN